MAFVAEELGVEIVQLPYIHREVSPLLDPLAVTRVARLIREVRPHILHTHTAKAGAIGRMAALVAGTARPPIVVHTFHGHVLHGYSTRLLDRGVQGRSSAARSRHDASRRGEPRSATTWSSSAWRLPRSSASSARHRPRPPDPRERGRRAELRALFGVPPGASSAGSAG